MAFVIKLSLPEILQCLKRPLSTFFLIFCKKNIFDVKNVELIHSAETRMPKWFFTIAPKMEREGYYGGTLSHEYKGTAPWGT